MRSNLFLSFYGDGPYWSDFLHLLAYPPNTNYVWPFRYPSNLLHPELESIVVDPQQAKSLVGTTAVVGTRFQNEQNKDQFIPIRKVTIREVELAAGVCQFHFFLGPHYDFRAFDDLSGASISVNVSNEFLAFFDDRIVEQDRECPSSYEGDNWNKFSLLVASNQFVTESAREGLWVNVAPKSKNARFGIQKSGDAFWWWRRRHANRSLYLLPGETLEIDYAHHIPSLKGQNMTLGEIDIELSVDSDDFEISAVGARPIGNYGVQRFSLAALRPTQITHKISIQFANKKLPSQDENYEIYTSSFELPVYVRWSFLHWLRSSAFPVLALFFSLLVLGVAGILEESLPKIIDGTLALSDFSENWIVIAAVVLASASATFAIPYFKEMRK